MTTKNNFFKKQKYILLSKIFNVLGKKKITKDVKINNITDLETASINDISFINNLKYLEILKESKAKYVICNVNHTNKIKNYCHPIIVTNVLKSVYNIANLFYPDSLDDAVDFSVNTTNKKIFKNVKF